MISRRSMIRTGALSCICAAAPIDLASIAHAQKGPQSKIFTGIVSGVAVGGYDPVAYFTEGRPVKGSAEFKINHLGAEWRFANAANQQAFSLAPEKYMPQFGGHCAWAVGSKGYLAKGDPLVWKIVDGKLYLNYDAGVQRAWEKDIPGFIKTGEANWPRLDAR